MTPFRASPGFTEPRRHFDFAVEDGVATLTRGRPERRGALTFDAYADLRDLLAELPHRGDARVLVIMGTGRGFCSGGDVEEIIGALQRMEAGDRLSSERAEHIGLATQVVPDDGLPAAARTLARRVRHDHREFYPAWSEGRKPAWSGR